MNHNETSSQSRASEVWTRFIGMFGGDAVERKYGKKGIPPEWVAALSHMKQYEVDRGLRRLVYSGRDAVPSLPAFTKLCRTVANDDIEEGPRPIALPPPDHGTWDRWAEEAGRHLFGYILRRVTHDPYTYGPVMSRAPGALCFSSAQAAATKVLVAYKNAWAQDMREWGVDPATGEVLIPTPEERRRTWEDCMRMAEDDIAAMRAKAAA